MLHRSAVWLADRDRLPDSISAVAGYYGESGVFDYRSLLLKRRVDEVVGEMLDRLFAELERAIADELGYDDVSLGYDTKLVLPAKLTLGQLYRELEPVDHHRAEETTRLVVEALIDGDMRDAINDDEFEDFELDRDIDDDERRRVAEIAQAHLQRRVENQLTVYSASVRETYESAVDLSNTHQSSDERFRELMAAVQRGEADTDRIASEYRDVAFEEPPELFTEDELALPYLKTQYERVGILYDAMFEFYREAGMPIGHSFHRAIVLAIIGAQIWLDDIDDFEDDIRSGQLTPVTAEYLLADDEGDPRAAVTAVGHQYLDRAREEATAADSALTGIAVEYISRSGNPESLPSGIEIRRAATPETGDLETDTGRPTESETHEGPAGEGGE